MSWILMTSSIIVVMLFESHPSCRNRLGSNFISKSCILNATCPTLPEINVESEVIQTSDIYYKDHILIFKDYKR